MAVMSLIKGGSLLWVV